MLYWGVRWKYEYNDLLIGYRFADIAYTKNGYDDVHIDRFLINDVKEQDGGGGEVISLEDEFNWTMNMFKSRLYILIK